MEIIFITLCFLVGIILLAFNEKIIRIFKTDKYIDHRKDKLRKVVAGIGLIILGFWGLYGYLFK